MNATRYLKIKHVSFFLSFGLHYSSQQMTHGRLSIVIWAIFHIDNLPLFQSGKKCFHWRMLKELINSNSFSFKTFKNVTVVYHRLINQILYDWLITFLDNPNRSLIQSYSWDWVNNTNIPKSNGNNLGRAFRTLNSNTC